MKLYTEEQVIKAIDLARLQGSEPFYVKYTEEEILNLLTPIEVKSEIPINLPSDEEIEKYLKSFPYTKHLDDGQYNDGVIVGAELAIEWMRSKLVTFKSE